MFFNIKRFCLANYYKPTPKNIRKIADSIIVATTCTSASTLMINDHHYVAFTIFIMGAIAKFVSNLLAEEGEDKNK